MAREEQQREGKRGHAECQKFTCVYTVTVLRRRRFPQKRTFLVLLRGRSLVAMRQLEWNVDACLSSVKLGVKSRVSAIVNQPLDRSAVHATETIVGEPVEGHCYCIHVRETNLPSTESGTINFRACVVDFFKRLQHQVPCSSRKAAANLR